MCPCVAGSVSSRSSLSVFLASRLEQLCLIIIVVFVVVDDAAVLPVLRQGVPQLLA